MSADKLTVVGAHAAFLEAEAAKEAAFKAYRAAQDEFVAAHGRFKLGDEIHGFKTRHMRRGKPDQQMRIVWTVKRFRATPQANGEVAVVYSGRGALYKGMLMDFHDGATGKLLRAGVTQDSYED